MHCLTSAQKSHFETNGYLVLEDALDSETLGTLRNVFAHWNALSARYNEPFGSTFDSRPRFDLDPTHNASTPAVRRIASPVEISDEYLAAMRNSRGLDAVTELIGPNVCFSNSKINAKRPGATTDVKFHQDFAFEPHTNDSLIAVLYFLDEVTAENGPLQVVPGSHNDPVHAHWHDGVFTGAVSETIASRSQAAAVSCTGPAGSACLMHTRLIHGSAPNLSTGPRTLFICTYAAEDSMPLQDNHIPSVYMSELVRGERSGRVRATPYTMVMPEIPTGASFFSQQARIDKMS